MKVFWSWQSDTPGKIGRHFVREALSKAISELKIEIELDEPTGRDSQSELHLDQDRQGVPGSPDLARVILEKISKSSVFVADVTAVGATSFDRIDGSGKKLINANVAIELGYALGTLTDSALLMVMNEHFGAREDLPFDLKAKAGPLIFRLAPSATKEEVAAESRKLTAQLKEAIALCLRGKAEEIQRATPFPAAKEKDGPARFRSRGEAIGIRSDNLPFGMDSEAPVFLAQYLGLWLRVMPLFAIGKKWPSHELRKHALSGSFDLRPISEGATIFGIRAEDGFGVCAPYPAYSDTATSIAFAFETGEVWSVDTDQLRLSEQHIPFLEELLARRLQSYARFLETLGIEPPFRWICGMTGIKGFRLHIPTLNGFSRPDSGPQCLSETIKVEGVFDGKESVQNALLPFFKEVFDRCGVPRPSHLPQ